MPRFAANISWLFQEYPFPERFAAAMNAGFSAVECLSPYAYPPHQLALWLREAGLEMVLISVPAGVEGDWGLAALPGREGEFERSLALALDYAEALDCRRIHVLAGVGAGEEAARVYVRNLALACGKAADRGCMILIEPINGVDIPGYFLTRMDQAESFRKQIDAENLWLQYDFYHRQRVEGELMAGFVRHQLAIGHIQVGNVPGRHEPDFGEINYGYIFAELDRLGYGGWVGCEYAPRHGSEASLGWMRG